MFGWFKERTRFAQIAGIWFDITNIDTGDRGQIAVHASNILKVRNYTPEDAWLLSVVNWTHKMPYQESQVLLAEGLARFLDDPRSQGLFSKEAKAAAATVALEILGPSS